MDLNVKIGADVGEAVKGLDRVNNEFEELNKQLIATQKYLPGFTSRIEELKAKIAALPPQQQAAAEGLKKIATESKAAEAASNGFAKGIGKAYSGLRTLANLIPGIGIGGLIGLIAGPLIDAFNELFTSTSKAGKALKETFSESAASVGGNIARLQALVSIAQDVTKSDNARKEALGALNKEYDGFNGKLTLANINTKVATDLIDKQTSALVRQAQIKGVQDLITDETKKAAENARKDLADNLTILQRLQNVFVSVAGGAGTAGADAIVSGLKNRDKQLKESAKNVDTYKDSLKNLLGEDAEAGTLFKEPKPSKAKEIKDKIVKALKFKPDDLEKMFFDESTVSFKVPAFVELDFKKSLRSTGGNEGLSGILGKEAFEELTMKGKLAGMGITKGIQNGLEVGIDGLRFPELKKLFEDAKKRMDDFNSAITETMQGTLTDAFSKLGENLGSGESLFAGFLQILGDGLSALGKQIIALSPLIQGLKAALKTLNPALMLPAGIALVAIGAVLSKAKIPGFAAGVTNFSGGLAMVGERGPELVRLPRGSDVIPNHLLGGVGQAQTNVFIPDVRLRGKDMVLVFNRASQTIGRNG